MVDLESFIRSFWGFIVNFWGVLRTSGSFKLWNYQTSIADILVVVIILSISVSLFWKGGKG